MPGQYSLADVSQAPKARADSLKGGPADMPDDAHNPARKGFMESFLDTVTAPYELVRGLVKGDIKLSDVPRGMLEGVGNTLIKAGSGNLAGAAGDIAGGAIVGKLGSEVAGKVPALKVPAGLKTAAEVATNPEVIRKGVKVLPKGPAALDFFDTIRKALADRRTSNAASESAEAQGAMAPAVWADYLMPGPASQIPANASPAQLAPFSPQTVLDYLQERAKPALEQSEPAKEVAKRPARNAKVVTIPSPEPEFPAETYAASARATKAGKLAQLLHEHSIPYEDAKLMGDAEWAQAAQAAGVKIPSADSVKLTLFELKKLGRQGKLSEMNPKAAQIASDLDKEMNK